MFFFFFLKKGEKPRFQLGHGSLLELYSRGRISGALLEQDNVFSRSLEKQHISMEAEINSLL